MPSVHLIGFKGRLLLISIGIILPILGIFGSQDQSISWAAPEQNPLMQTIPPRPPTTEPEPTTQPTPVTPPPGQPSNENDTGNKDDNRDEILVVPVDPPEQSGDSIPDQPFPSSEETGQDGQGNNSSSLSAPSAKENDREDTRPLPVVEPGFETSGQTSTSVVNPTDLESSPPTLNLDEDAGVEHSPLAERPLPMPQSNLKSPVDEDGSLIWLYAFGLGVILILTGIFLVKRA